MWELDLGDLYAIVSVTVYNTAVLPGTYAYCVFVISTVIQLSGVHWSHIYLAALFLHTLTVIPSIHWHCNEQSAMYCRHSVSLIGCFTLDLNKIFPIAQTTHVDLASCGFCPGGSYVSCYMKISWGGSELWGIKVKITVSSWLLSELDNGPMSIFFRPNPTQSIKMYPIQSASGVHTYIQSNQTRKLCATNCCNADLQSWLNQYS